MTYPNQPTTNKLDDYLHQESQSQFSDEKREQVETEKLGKGHLGRNIMQELAKIKGRNVGVCEWCEEELIIPNVRVKVILCPRCESGRSVIEGFLRNRKQEHLTQQDKIKISQTKTVRYGSGKAFN